MNMKLCKPSLGSGKNNSVNKQTPPQKKVLVLSVLFEVQFIHWTGEEKLQILKAVVLDGPANHIDTHTTIHTSFTPVINPGWTTVHNCKVNVTWFLSGELAVSHRATCGSWPTCDTLSSFHWLPSRSYLISDQTLLNKSTLSFFFFETKLPAFLLTVKINNSTVFKCLVFIKYWMLGETNGGGGGARGGGSQVKSLETSSQQNIFI